MPTLLSGHFWAVSIWRNQWTLWCIYSLYSDLMRFLVVDQKSLPFISWYILVLSVVFSRVYLFFFSKMCVIISFHFPFQCDKQIFLNENFVWWVEFFFDFSHKNGNTKVMFFIFATWKYGFDMYWGFLWKQFPNSTNFDFFFQITRF